ncbi:MAG: TIGR03564 family F420-dependent LLM class oxidoreductase [Deltaproteobacteria bacterium]|nr:TIGR03564 family F420-dependent LLM class oxidoreductase [Deltaproteobacteria bacterium]MBW2363332.1 TIGR03564 family F420-dependent LLM class oxidoreductase [Deltaproteobacteria bacterium]
MRFGVMVGGHGSRISVDGFVETARDLEARGFDTMWIPHVFGHDAINVATLIGRETERIELGTAVVPTYPRHPAALAQQAITAGAACRGRFTLGIGLSHPPVIEKMLGLSYARRAQHMREYMAVLGPLLRGEPAKFEGEEYRVAMTVEVPDAEPVPVVLAALGDRMLAIAAREAAGTILWMAGFGAIERHVVPKLRTLAQQAGRPEPRIVAGMHIVLTSNAGAANERIDQLLEQYRMMPSYRAMIEREGSATPADFAIIGDEKVLDAGLERLRSIGVTDFDANILDFEEGSTERTLDYLESRL